MEKMFEEPQIIKIGKMEELVGQSGSQWNDGYDYSDYDCEKCMYWEGTFCGKESCAR